ncbi:MAG: DNA-binding response regulator [Hymenobacteraceae bacterium]|nr:DNA-binding response regulator [Hymenobacteraceae bacterium]MDX5395105.1 DNA-binding response regulator [Hymenobacteraceae bacterium]MDX5444100.1 DNA-binding response regulator [Hymenobacteraceae bacterium]MDX5511143.1 DNA-binding response regulator [Hymenobacteraceae bacterium]
MSIFIVNYQSYKLMQDKILIIEDERIVAENLSALLQQAGYTTGFITDNLHEAKQLFNSNSFSLIVSDIQLHTDVTGPDIVRELHKQKKVPVVYLSAHSEEKTVTAALDTDPVAYVLKPFTDRQLLIAVKMALKQTTDALPDQQTEKPTNRELEIIQCLSKGYNSRKTGEALFISEHTVNTHRRNLLRRYNVESSSELITLSIRNKWIKI